MDIISMILFAVLFLTQTVLAVLLFTEKRNSKRRDAAAVDYIDSSLAEWDENIKAMVNHLLFEHRADTDEQYRQMSETVNMLSQNVKEKVDQLSGYYTQAQETMDERFRQFTLDYTQAQEAANKVNDFASSLASIFDYDPIRSRQKNRNKEV
jgi:gas vesicle protein